MTTDEAYAALRAPFHPQHINFRVGNKRSGQYTILSYLDARQVSERLTSVDPLWSVEHNDLHTRSAGTKSKDVWTDGNKTQQPYNLIHASVRASLTVTIGDLRVTRSDVGEEVGDEDDLKLIKTVYSDALKRAAVHFGVGAYLYEIDMGTIPTSGVEHGRIKPETVDVLRKRYEGLVAQHLLQPWQVDTLLIVLGDDSPEKREWLAGRWAFEYESLMQSMLSKRS